MDKNTHQSACHARAHNNKVDYSGKCFSRKLVEYHSECVLILTVVQKSRGAVLGTHAYLYSSKETWSLP